MYLCECIYLSRDNRIDLCLFLPKEHGEGACLTYPDARCQIPYESEIQADTLKLLFFPYFVKSYDVMPADITHWSGQIKITYICRQCLQQ